MKVKDLIESLKTRDPEENVINTLWSKEDVLMIDPNLTDEQCIAVLERFDHKMDLSDMFEHLKYIVEEIKS